MLAQEIDFHEIFKISPTVMALFTADLEFIDANDEFVAATGRPLEELLGHNVFDVFPKMPSDPANPKWTALEAAMTSGKREAYALTRYDLEDPIHPGVFLERYWSSVVTPIHGSDGEVEVLELSAREVTSIIAHYREIDAEHV
ncbi:MAG TPA: PAS domain-containing protein [Streptosporangiaceae bacterium]|nr:PAS domain-containing protein [Streptosporangiaceae bacterium]